MKKIRNVKFLSLLTLTSLVMLTGCSFKGNSIDNPTDLFNGLPSINSESSQITSKEPDTSLQSSVANENNSSISSVSESSVEMIESIENSSLDYYESCSSCEENLDSKPRDFIPDENYDFMDGISKIMNNSTDIEELKKTRCGRKCRDIFRR